MSDKIFVSTGEVSGDLHLSYIAKHILEEDPSVKIYGVAGEHSKAVGVEIIQDIKELAIMGFVEVISKYGFLKRKAREYVDFIKKERVNKVILVDYGGFNLRFLQLLKEEAPKVEIFYYIPPKVWVWGEKRVEKIKMADHIVVIFPWEVEFYKKHGVDVVYYGNPFVEKYDKVQEIGESILLLPGSRKQEIKTIFPEMLKVVKAIPEKKFIVKLSSREHVQWIDEDLSKIKNLKLEFDMSLKECVSVSQIAIATSGTVTLELALLGIPTVVVYKGNPINAFIARKFLNIGFISLPNLTLNEEVFPELIQKRCTAKEIIHAMNAILQDRKLVTKKIENVRQKLSGEHITKKYAQYILEGKKDEEI